MQVAIDGPAGSGKSTVCKMVANRYGLTYLDTGAMYRAATWFSRKFTDEKLANKLKDVEFIFSNLGKNLSLKVDDKIYNVTKEIRTPIITSSVSKIAAMQDVRAVLTEKQQLIAKDNDVIMEGRDITTVVLPNADIKIFLTASVAERAARRFAEWKDKENAPTFEEVVDSIKRRDKDDSSRKIAPLKKADDAILIDTTGLTLEEVSVKIGKLIEEKRA